MTSRRVIGGVDGCEAVGDEGFLGALKSQRPRRRKQAAQVARPDIGEGSACQPNSASVSAKVLIGGCCVFV